MNPYAARFAIALFAASAAVPVAAQVGPFGRFEGEIVARWNDGGRTMTLLQPYSYIDGQGRRWPVPAGTTVDGASIPRAAWTAIGGPFEGLYRNASVIHDHYCVTRQRSWRETHRMFYDGMRANGVGAGKAAVMYWAVLNFGPRWRTFNANFGFRREAVGSGDLPGAIVVSEAPPALDERTFAAEAARIEAAALSPEAIEAMVEPTLTGRR